MMITSTTAPAPAPDTNVVAFVYSVWLMYGRSPTDSSVAPEWPKFPTCTPLPNMPARSAGYDLLDEEAPYPAVLPSPTQATCVGVRTWARARAGDRRASAQANTAMLNARGAVTNLGIGWGMTPCMSQSGGFDQRL